MLSCLAALLCVAANASAQPFAPQPVVPGGLVLPLYPPDSPMLKKDRLQEAEVVTMSTTVPGRVNSIVNVHNPSIEFHPAGAGNTGAAVIVVPGGGHTQLVIGSEGADFVPFFYNYGVSTIILRYRLRKDGYVAEVDAVNDMLQAIKLARAHAAEWHIDPKKIGAIGFSAGAELTAPAAMKYDKDSRPDFVGIIYPGPSPFRDGAKAPIPDDAPPAFIAGAGVGDAVHAVWADEFFSAFLKARIPNLEMHIYGNGVHGGGLTDRGGIPFGTWQYRFIDWFRELGFLEKSGVETKAARDVAARVAKPPAR